MAKLYDNAILNIAGKSPDLDQVDNTSDINKPISNATQTALNKKSNLDTDNKVKVDELRGSSLTYDPINSKVTLIDAIGDNYSIDLPIENLFKSADYDETSKTLQLQTVNGGSLDVSLNDLVDLPEITLSTSDPVTAPSDGKKLYFNTTTGKVWFNINEQWGNQLNLLSNTEKLNFKSAYDHSNIKGNPHDLTKSDIGLSNVNNTADGDKEVLSAVKLKTVRTFNFIGDIKGSTTFDGTANPSIELAFNAIVPILFGGTGASTIESARTNLKIQETILSNFSSSTGTISNTDTIVTAISKIDGNLGAIDSALTSILGS